MDPLVKVFILTTLAFVVTVAWTPRVAPKGASAPFGEPPPKHARRLLHDARTSPASFARLAVRGSILPRTPSSGVH